MGRLQEYALQNDHLATATCCLLSIQWLSGLDSLVFPSCWYFAAVMQASNQFKQQQQVAKGGSDIVCQLDAVGRHYNTFACVKSSCPLRGKVGLMLLGK